MTVEQAVQEGDFRGALVQLEQETSGPRADPARLLMRFGIEIRLQQFPAAAETMRRLIAAAPDLAQPMAGFAAAAQAEEAIASRQRDPARAGQRASIGLPPPYALALAKASVQHASGDFGGARAAIAEAAAATPRIAGTITRMGGTTQRFTAITDSDELTGATVPVYDGAKVLDLPFSELSSIAFLDPKTSFDVMWSLADIVTVDGKQLRGRVPSFYSGTGLSSEAPVRTGQMTVWNRERGYAEALGQRDWSVTLADGGMTVVGMLGVRRVDFENPRRSAGAPGARMDPQVGPASPAAAGLRSIAKLAFFALAGRAALPVIFRVLGMAGLGLGSQGVYDGVRLVVTVAAVVLYLVWFGKFYDWVRQSRGGTAFSTGFAIGSWFIPFLNLVMPYRALNDAATRTLGTPAPIVGIWWAAFLCSTVLTTMFSLIFSGAMVPIGSAGLLNALMWLMTISQIVAYGLWAKIVQDLSAKVR